jgi:hypothetical protein
MSWEDNVFRPMTAKRKPARKAPQPIGSLKWSCPCGQRNLNHERVCMACGGPKPKEP